MMTGTQGFGPMYPTIPHIYMDECSWRSLCGPMTVVRAGHAEVMGGGDLRRLIAVRPEERRSCGETEFVSELKPHTPDAFPRRSMWKTGSIPDVTERKTCLTGVCGNTDNSQPGAKVPFPMIYDDLTLPSRLRLIARGWRSPYSAMF